MDKNDPISRNKLLSHAIPVYGKYDDSAEFEAVPVNYIKGAPAIKPEELLNKAQIIWKERTLGGYRYTKCPECNKEVEVEKPITSGVPYCSRCGKRLDDRFMHYCPNCGAKMWRDKS